MRNQVNLNKYKNYRFIMRKILNESVDNAIKVIDNYPCEIGNITSSNFEHGSKHFNIYDNHILLDFFKNHQNLTLQNFVKLYTYLKSKNLFNIHSDYFLLEENIFFDQDGQMFTAEEYSYISLIGLVIKNFSCKTYQSIFYYLFENEKCFDYNFAEISSLDFDIEDFVFEYMNENFNDLLISEEVCSFKINSSYEENYKIATSKNRCFYDLIEILIRFGIFDVEREFPINLSIYYHNRYNYHYISDEN